MRVLRGELHSIIDGLGAGFEPFQSLDEQIHSILILVLKGILQHQVSFIPELIKVYFATHSHTIVNKLIELTYHRYSQVIPNQLQPELLLKLFHPHIGTHELRKVHSLFFYPYIRFIFISIFLSFQLHYYLSELIAEFIFVNFVKLVIGFMVVIVVILLIELIKLIVTIVLILFMVTI